jgi:hypothetical protein
MLLIQARKFLPKHFRLTLSDNSQIDEMGAKLLKQLIGNLVQAVERN